MTDREIIKALEHCTSSTTSEACNGCPLYDTTICTEMENGLQIYSLDLIKRLQDENDRYKEKCSKCGEKTRKTIIYLQDLLAEQKAEIERLRGMVSQNEGVLPQYETLIISEAIKEFAEELKRRLIAGGIFPVLVKNEIGNLVKEMTEGKQDAVQDTRAGAE